MDPPFVFKTTHYKIVEYTRQFQNKSLLIESVTFLWRIWQAQTKCIVHTPNFVTSLVYILFYYRISWWEIIFIWSIVICFSPFICLYVLISWVINDMKKTFCFVSIVAAPYWTFRLQRSSSVEITTLFIVFNPLMLSDVLKADFMSTWNKSFQK